MLGHFVSWWNWNDSETLTGPYSRHPETIDTNITKELLGNLQACLWMAANVARAGLIYTLPKSPSSTSVPSFSKRHIACCGQHKSLRCGRPKLDKKAILWSPTLSLFLLFLHTTHHVFQTCGRHHQEKPHRRSKSSTRDLSTKSHALILWTN